MNKLINGGIKIFGWAFNGFVVFTLIAAAFIFVGWCILWALLSAISN